MRSIRSGYIQLRLSEFNTEFEAVRGLRIVPSLPLVVVFQLCDRWHVPC